MARASPVTFPSRPVGALDGRVAIVTGAGGPRGIGRAIALAYASEGCRVTVAGGRAADQVAGEIRQTGARALALKTDVSRPDDVRAMVDRTVEEFGRLDVICNNAGILRFGRLLDISLDDWNRTLAVNLTGLFLCTQAAAACMIEQGAGGRIINISSLCGHIGCPSQVSYAASKAGVEGFTKSIAEDLGEHGITANCIAPGGIYTDMVGTQRPSAYQPVRRSGSAIPEMALPDDLTGAAVFLASEASNWITGTVLVVDGGRLVR